MKHPLFGASHRLSRFLRYVIQEALAGRSDQLKEHVIGVEVFERDASYNPQEDPIVRIMAGRLRSKLAEYYQSAGKEYPVLIEIPRGGYVPRLCWRRAHPEAPPAAAFAPAPPPSRRRNLVGRDAELEKLMQAYASVCSGSGVVLTASGEAGMGKTTLVEDFLGAIEVQQAAFVAQGRCSERLAQTDAFAPIYECLDRFLREDLDGQITRWMQSLAPSWFLQVGPDPNAAPAKQVSTASHERMRRELIAFLERLAQAPARGAIPG